MTEEQLKLSGWRKNTWNDGVYYTKFCQVDKEFERCLKFTEESGSLFGYGFTVYRPEELIEFEETRILPVFWIDGHTPPIDVKELKKGECLVKIWWDESSKCHALSSQWLSVTGKLYGSYPLKLDRQFLLKRSEVKELE